MELESKNGSSNKILDFPVNCEKCREKSDCQSNAWQISSNTISGQAAATRVTTRNISNTKYGRSSMVMFNKFEGCWKLGWEDLVCSTDSALFKIMLVYSNSMEV